MWLTSLLKPDTKERDESNDGDEVEALRKLVAAFDQIKQMLN
jgi:hypothetical protein